MADSESSDAKRALRQLKFAMLSLIAINTAILVKVFLPSTSKPVEVKATATLPASTKPIDTQFLVEKSSVPPERSENASGPNIVRAPTRGDTGTPSIDGSAQGSVSGNSGGGKRESPGMWKSGVEIVSDPRIGTNASLVGVVRLEGTPPPEREITPIKSDPKCGALHDEPVFTRGYVVGKNKGLANVMVTIENPPAGRLYELPLRVPVIDQIGCMYEPYVTAVMTGQKFILRNSDSFMHNVNAMAKINRGFNFAQAFQGQENEKVFDKPELVKLVCNIHPWMAGYILVVDHPFFSVTDTNGGFNLPPGLAAGHYTLKFSHLKAGEKTVDVLIEPGKVTVVSMELTAR